MLGMWSLPVSRQWVPRLCRTGLLASQVGLAATRLLAFLLVEDSCQCELGFGGAFAGMKILEIQNYSAAYYNMYFSQT